MQWGPRMSWVHRGKRLVEGSVDHLLLIVQLHCQNVKVVLCLPGSRLWRSRFPTWPGSKGFTHSTCLKASNDFPDHYGRGVLKFHSASASIESTLKFFQDDTAVFTTHHCLVTISLDNGFAAFLYEVREGMFLEILTAKWQPLRSLTTEVKIPDWHCALNTV